jgi:hypothetical protein
VLNLIKEGLGTERVRRLAAVAAVPASPMASSSQPQNQKRASSLVLARRVALRPLAQLQPQQRQVVLLRAGAEQVARQAGHELLHRQLAVPLGAGQQAVGTFRRARSPATSTAGGG